MPLRITTTQAAGTFSQTITPPPGKRVELQSIVLSVTVGTFNTTKKNLRVTSVVGDKETGVVVWIGGRYFGISGGGQRCFFIKWDNGGETSKSLFGPLGTVVIIQAVSGVSAPTGKLSVKYSLSS